MRQIKLTFMNLACSVAETFWAVGASIIAGVLSD